MLRVRFLLCLALTMSLAVGVAYGQMGKVSKKMNVKTTVMTFDAKDMNKDGKLTWEEYRGDVTAPGAVANLRIVFQTMDTNKDGVVTPEEYAAYYLQKLINGTYESKNINKTGKMTWNEYRGNETTPTLSARLHYEFQTMDVDKKGFVTPEDFTNYNIRMAFMGTYNSRDINKDGKLSWEEFQGRETHPGIIAKLKEIFRAMDTNDDGAVTIEEFNVYWTKPMIRKQYQNQTQNQTQTQDQTQNWYQKQNTNTTTNKTKTTNIKNKP
jgi:Ca2+-binding EF-hand superfamily protein